MTGNSVPPGSFDVLFEHTCLCAIPPERRADYARAAATALRDGGLLLAVFFTKPENPDQQFVKLYIFSYTTENSTLRSASAHYVGTVA